MTEESDHDLLRRFVAGRDEHAFGEIVRRHLGLVLGTASRITGRPPLAEEVAQDVFSLTAARAGSLLRGKAPLAVWLHRTARFKALRAAEKERRRLRGLERFRNEPDTRPGHPAAWQPLLRHLDSALDALRAPDREVLLLHFHGNLTHAQISTRLGQKPEAVRQRSRRALERLRNLLRARHGAEVPASGFAAALPGILSGSGSVSPVPAGVLARTAAGSLPPASRLSAVTGFFQTMNATQTAAIAATVLCLSALTWQEFSLASARAGAASLRSRQASRASGGSVSPPVGKIADAGEWEHQPEEPGSGRLTPEALREFARRLKRARENDLSAMPGLARFVMLLQGPELRRAAEMSAGLDMAPEDRAALLELLLGSLADQPEDALTLAAGAWGSLPEEGRGKFTAAAARTMREWAGRDPAAALAWFRNFPAAGNSPPETAAAGQPRADLAGALMSGLMSQKEAFPDAARELMTLLPPEGRSPALTAAVRHTKSGDLLRDIAALARELPEAARAAPLAAGAARLAQSVSLAEGSALFETIRFADPAARDAAAVATAVSSAINRNSSAPARREASWEWLSRQAAAGGNPERTQAQFLSGLAGGDPVWALDRFESIGGAAAGQEALAAFLEHIPEAGNRPENAAAAERYFRLAAGLTDPASRREALERARHSFPAEDPAAGRGVSGGAAAPAPPSSSSFSSPPPAARKPGSPGDGSGVP